MPARQHIVKLIVGSRHACQVNLIGIEDFIACHTLQIDVELKALPTESVAHGEEMGWIGIADDSTVLIIDDTIVVQILRAIYS